jgi:hypothetical protein
MELHFSPLEQTRGHVRWQEGRQPGTASSCIDVPDIHCQARNLQRPLLKVLYRIVIESQMIILDLGSATKRHLNHVTASSLEVKCLFECKLCFAHAVCIMVAGQRLVPSLLGSCKHFCRSPAIAKINIVNSGAARSSNPSMSPNAMPMRNARARLTAGCRPAGGP